MTVEVRVGNNDSKPPDGDAENLDYEPLPGLDDELTREQVRENVRQSDAEAVADAGDEWIAGLEESARQDGLAWEYYREAPAGAPGSEIVIYRLINHLFEWSGEPLSDGEWEWLERQPKGSIDKAVELILRREAGDQYVSYDEGILLDNLAVDWDAFLEEIERADRHEEGERRRAQVERDRRWYVSIRSLIHPMFALWTLLALTLIAFVFIFVLSSGGGDSTGDAANETQEPAPEATEDGTEQSSDTDVEGEETPSADGAGSDASGSVSAGDGQSPADDGGSGGGALVTGDFFTGSVMAEAPGTSFESLIDLLVRQDELMPDEARPLVEAVDAAIEDHPDLFRIDSVMAGSFVTWNQFPAGGGLSEITYGRGFNMGDEVSRAFLFGRGDSYIGGIMIDLHLNDQGVTVYGVNVGRNNAGADGSMFLGDFLDGLAQAAGVPLSGIFFRDLTPEQNEQFYSNMEGPMDWSFTMNGSLDSLATVTQDPGESIIASVEAGQFNGDRKINVTLTEPMLNGDVFSRSVFLSVNFPDESLLFLFYDCSESGCTANANCVIGDACQGLPLDTFNVTESDLLISFSTSFLNGIPDLVASADVLTALNLDDPGTTSSFGQPITVGDDPLPC